ncbi:isotrichodermin C-15 hydroxylase [Corynespora cassiicola Philippines]|uniref:Isotrichodermin C-15 hydroxylase n=1 Tax=Corynespora cassiicola Philippines TaxID=1448308 RepID=A0A2T2NQS0_CORCC|nr:isotrichodermin C-15 hydroxylase [Corynespora cassiicola Philippines]
MAYIDIIIGSDTWSRVGNLTILLSLLPITLWIYNIFFHSLAGFDGPFLWRASRLPYMRAVWSGHFPYEIQALHARYGEVVRVAPNELSFMSPTAWDDIYSNRDGANPEAFRKSELWHGNPEGGTTSIFVTPDLKAHSRIERFMDPAFTDRAVLQQEPIIRDYITTCIKKLRERMSLNGRTTINIVDWLNFTLFDIIGDLCFGQSFGCLEKCEYEGWMDQMAASIKLHYLSINLRYYPIVNNLLKPLAGFLIPKEIIKQHMAYRQSATEKLNRRLSPDTVIDRPDIASKLIRSEHPEQRLTPDEVTLNSMLFINAASETTATALTGAINNLIQNPESLSALEFEVRGFSSSSDLTLQALSGLPYLNAVLKEALRMCNPNPIGHMRITPPDGGIVSGQFVPGNTMLTIQPVALSYSPKYFHEPESWRPERWLHEAETNLKSPYYHDHRRGVRAFGWGPYNCAGEPLGWAWMRLLLATIIWTFDLKKADTPNSSIAWDKQDVFAIVIKHRLDVALTERTV